MNIYDILNRARSLKEEYRLDSVTPERLGALHEDTLKYINEYQLLASSPAIHKTFTSISAMQSSSSPKSDLTGKPLKAGQLVVIVPTDPSDSTAGDVYRYDRPSGNTSKWTFIAKLGAVPADAELSATSTNPPQNQVVTAKFTELESKTNEIPHPEFVENCPYIVELYINEKGRELDVSTVHLTYSENHFIRFSNTAKDTFTAKTKLDADGFYNGIIEIVSENGGVNCGYIIVDWTQMHEGKTVVKPILEPAYNLDYSPSIKVMLDDRVTLRDTFVKNCPYIKELYINEAGKEAGLATLHEVTSQPEIRFSNESKDAFIGATATFNSVEEATGIIPIYKFNEPSTIYGYIVIDWDNVQYGSPLTKLNKSAFVLDYSPSIKEMLEPNAREGIDYGDRKPLEVCSATIDNAERIWFQLPKGKKPSHIDTINYRAFTGLVGFTKVTYDKENNKVLNHELIITSGNSEDANGKIVTLSVDVHLDENQYVGITGAFRYLNDDENKYGFTSLNFAIADKSLGYAGEQVLGYEALDSSSLESKIIDSQSEINGLSASVCLGDRKPLELCKSSVSNTGSIWFQYPIQRTGKIDTINFLSKIGTTNFYVVTYDSESNFIDYELLISVVNSAFENNTIKTIKVNVELEPNQYIGINGDFRFISSYDIYGLGYYSRFVKLDTSVVSNISNQILGFEALNMDGSESQIQLIKDYLYKPEKWAVLHKDRLTETKDYIIGSQSFGNFGMVVNGLLVVNKFYSLSQRYAKFICKFGSNTVARFGTTLSNSWNTYFDVDIANKTIRCKSLESKTSYLLRAGDVISITICKNYNVQSCEVCNMTLGKKEVFEWQFNGQGGVGTGAIGTKVDTGMQYDYYGVTLMSGSQYEIQDLIIGSAKCDLVIYGDSITEGEAYYPANMLNTHWVQLIINKLKGNAVASGRSGTAMAALMERIVNEIPFIKPKYVMVTIGTNGGNTVSGLSNMVEYIQSQGAECILNHIPANINAGGVSNHINTNNVIDEVRAKYGLKGADFDLATAINRNPSEGVNQDMMWKEDYGGSTGTVYHHPNDLGSMAMMEQVEIDIPFIFEL